MPLTTEQILKSLKLEGKTFENEEEFVSEFSKVYAAQDAPISEEKKQKVIGSLLGTLETSIRRELKEFGLDPQFDKTKPFQDNVSEWLTEARKAKAKEIEELKAKAGDGGDAKIQALTAEVDKFKNKFTEEKQAREQALAAWTQKEQEYEGRIKNTKKDFILAQEKAKNTKWKSGITELEKLGFETYFKTKYKTDIDEKDGLIITDNEGKQIPNPKVAGQFLSFSEVLEMEGVKEKVWEVNPHSRNTPPVHKVAPEVTTPSDQSAFQRKVATPFR